MELKSYQQEVINDLSGFIEQLENEMPDLYDKLIAIKNG